MSPSETQAPSVSDVRKVYMVVLFHWHQHDASRRRSVMCRHNIASTYTWYREIGQAGALLE